jgi:hypothetical protein
MSVFHSIEFGDAFDILPKDEFDTLSAERFSEKRNS